jgi:hypothetical protein
MAYNNFYATKHLPPKRYNTGFGLKKIAHGYTSQSFVSDTPLVDLVVMRRQFTTPNNFQTPKKPNT